MQYVYRITGHLLALLLIGYGALAHAVGDFALIDDQGYFHQISRHNEADAVVLVVQQPGTAGDALVRAELQRLQQQFADDAVVFLLLNPDVDARRSSDLLLDPQAADRLPLLLDSAQVITRRLGARMQGEAFILEPTRQRTVFRGALLSEQLADEQQSGEARHYLQEAIVAVLAGEDPMSEAPLPAGEAIAFPYYERLAGREISYEHEIAPLLMRRCAHCHVQDGLAPWAMDRYLMVRGWSPMMRETIVTRRMPPGQLDGQIGDWQTSHELPDEEMALLLHWFDEGALQPEGEGDPLPTRELASDAWRLGEPDVIIEVPEEQVPATGVIDFLIKRSVLNLPEDKWVRAVAYDVGAKSVLHSLLLYALDSDADIRQPEDMIHPDNAHFLSVYVPGEATEQFRDDSGFLLPAGSDLSFKIRYTSSGRAAVDNTRIGLYFYDEPPAMQLQTVRLRKDDLRIPANAADHRELVETPALAQDSHFESFSAHAHARGSAVRLIARYPDGERQLLINVANYNFNWQLAYNLAERKFLPAGTVLEAETVYDNSPSNLLIADFDEEIVWGVSDQDEMFSHFVRIAVPRAQ